MPTVVPCSLDTYTVDVSRPFALRGHWHRFYENESYSILPSKKRLVGHILNKIVIWFFKPAQFS